MLADIGKTRDYRFFAKWKRRLGRVLTDSRWGRYYVQLKVCDPRHRQLIASVLSRFLPKNPSLNGSNEEIRPLVEGLKINGSVPVEGILSRQAASAIRAYLATKNCYDPARPEMKGFRDPDAAHPSCIHAYYPKADVAAAPHVLELANHPLLLDTVSAYFGVKPVISNISAWWLLHGFDPETNSQEVYVRRPEEFHRDLDDFAEVKLFVYLTDVDETAGPHAIVRTSHKWRLPRGRRVLELADPRYPMRENLQLITGSAGLAWLENTLTLHRGIIPTMNHRLMLTFAYSLLPVAVGPREPLLSKDRRRFDPYINQVLIEA